MRSRASSHPRRLQLRDLAVDRAALVVGARQVADADQELAGDLAAGEQERLLEELDPRSLVARVMRGDPGGERAVLPGDRLDAPGVLDDRVDLQAVADDARIGQQPLALD